MLELFVLLIGISIILVILFKQTKKETSLTFEPFENHYLSACPTGYKSFYNENGDMICCEGDVIANKCLGERQCVLNGASSANLPNCVSAIISEYAEKAKTQCPSSMMSYFEDKSQNMKGCTNGPLNTTMNGPKSVKQSTCYISKISEENMYSKNSCYNQKILDSTPCFGTNCTKELNQPVRNGPILVGIAFTDASGIHRVAYTRDSLENYLNKTNPNWKNQGLDLSRNIAVAEVAKAYFVDKTMSQSDIQM